MECGALTEPNRLAQMIRELDSAEAAIARHPDALQQAFDAGQKLVEE